MSDKISILWADDEAAQGVLHVGLKLSKDGETLILSKKNVLGNIVLVDSVSFPALGSNITYSRVPDGDANWMVRPATFSVTNGVISSVESPLSDVQVYPTQVKESFTVNNATGLMLTITDLTGKVMLQKKCTADRESIPIGFLQRGMYILSVGNNSLKLIKI